MNAQRLLAHFDRMADAPHAISRLRSFVLDLAVRGKLIKQDLADEPASAMLKRVAVEKSEGVKQKKYLAEPHVNELWDIPSNWCRPRVGEVLDFRYGKTLKASDRTVDGPVPVFGSNGIVGYTTEPLTVRPSVIVGRKGSAGALNKCNGPSWTTDVAYFVEVPSFFDLDFLFISLTALDLGKLGKGVKPGLSRADAYSKAICIPPPTEQHRIVAKVDELMALCDQLDEARTARENTRDRLSKASYARLSVFDTDDAGTIRSNARFVVDVLPSLTARADQVKRLRQTIRNLAVRGKLVGQDSLDEPASVLLKRIAMERDHLVDKRIIRRQKSLAAIRTDEPPFEVPSGWKWSRIGDAVLFTQYGTSSRSSASKSGVPVLTMGNIQDGFVIYRNEKSIPDTADELPALYLKRFDLLYNRTNSAELVGKTGIYLGEDDRRTFASYLIRIRASLKYFNPHFLNLAMNTTEFRKTQIVPLIKKQTGQANVNGTALRNMLIPVPPLPEQHRIVAKVDELMILCDRLKFGLVTASIARRRLLNANLQELLSSAEKVFSTKGRGVRNSHIDARSIGTNYR